MSRRDPTADDGSVTAELALGLPTLLLVVVLAVHVLTAVATADRADGAAAFTARALGRGEAGTTVRSQLRADWPAAELTVTRLPRDSAGPERIAATVRVPLGVPAALAWALGGTRAVTGRAVAVDETALAFDVRDETP